MVAPDDDDARVTPLGLKGAEVDDAWSVGYTVSYLFTDRLEAGIRLAGSTDGGDFLPESQYGVVVNYGLFDGLNLGLEYQYGEFDTVADDSVSTAAAQLALEF